MLLVIHELLMPGRADAHGLLLVLWNRRDLRHFLELLTAFHDDRTDVLQRVLGAFGEAELALLCVGIGVRCKVRDVLRDIENGCHCCWLFVV